MIKKSLIFVLSLSCLSAFGNIQNVDTLVVSDKDNNFRIANFIIPTALIATGAILIHSDLDHNIQKRIHANVSRRYRHDEWIKYAPMAAMYALNFSGVQSRHNLRDQTIILANAALLTGISVQSVKHITKIPRPRFCPDYGSIIPGTKTAFPSGHTALAFTGAHVLFKEYRDVSPWIGVAGYLSATIVGALRMVNQRHWLSDVIAGAGFGIICVEISYLMLPLYHRLFGINDGGNSINSAMIVPMVGANFYGLGVSLRF